MDSVLSLKQIGSTLGKSSVVKQMYGTHDFTPTEFIKMIEDQVGDVNEFLKLKGIYMDKNEDYNKVVASGINVKNYFKDNEKKK